MSDKVKFIFVICVSSFLVHFLLYFMVMYFYYLYIILRTCHNLKLKVKSLLINYLCQQLLVNITI